MVAYGHVALRFSFHTIDYMGKVIAYVASLTLIAVKFRFML